MKTVCLAAALLLLPSLALAQHPCDRPEVATATVTEGVTTVSVCHPGTHVTGWALSVDGTRSVVNLTAGATANAQGLKEFTGTTTVTVGAHSVQVAAIYGTAGDGPKTAPFSLVVNPVMVAPSKLRIGS